jgi:hypothetical protein
MPDFWTSCGYRLLQQDAAGRLRITDAFLASFLERPELAPIAQSCAAERTLHESLASDPRRKVAAAEIAAIADTDAQENYRVWLRFRERLLAAPSLEAAYAALFAGQGVDVPPFFVQQLTQVLLRHLLDDDADPLAARAAEMLFRPQRVRVQDDGAVMAADEETVERLAIDGGFGSLGELLRQQKTPLRSIDLDVLSRDNAELYWERDERFDTAVSLNRGQPALDRLCRVMERWIRHFLGVEVGIVAQRAIEDERWSWHVGLDAEASGILDDLYHGAEVDEARLARLLCLFRLDFAQPAEMRPEVAGRPVYLAMAMDEQGRLRLKPQNLLHNLPLAKKS